MSDDNGGDRSQKTVAELLALHGGSSETSRRRRRRAADEGEAPEAARDVTDTAPQAIIDRIKGEGAADTQSGGAEEHPSRAAQQPVPQPPPAQQPAGRQSVPQQPPPQPPQTAPPPRPQQQPAQQPAQQQSQPMARPWPAGGRRAPLRPAQRAEPEPHTDRFPALDGDSAGQNGHAPANPDVSASAPPAGLARWRQRRQQEQAEETDVGVVPPVPAAGTDTRSETDGGPPTGAFTPSFDDEDEAGYSDLDFYDDYPDDDQDDYRDLGYEDEQLSGAEEDEDEYAEHEEQDDGRSPARQWLVLAGQLALGVVGGAGVWLGFSWLWGQMPSAALIAALVATLGLVWVVRKVRRAEDTQTTVLALLVGLVVTVSPAALLLVSR